MRDIYSIYLSNNNSNAFTIGFAAKGTSSRGGVAVEHHEENAEGDGRQASAIKSLSRAFRALQGGEKEK